MTLTLTDHLTSLVTMLGTSLPLLLNPHSSFGREIVLSPCYMTPRISVKCQVHNAVTVFNKTEPILLIFPSEEETSSFSNLFKVTE